ncbi:MAG TPA: AAA family ATPase [Methanoregulaceae archaeon]|nr:AAA family ATPase [Methanoregulaceae archaeon]
MRITVSGLPGSGTTSLARYLSQKHNFQLISAGEVFRQMAKEHSMTLAEFGELAERDPAIDKKIDLRQKEIAESRDAIIVEGRLSGWMVPSADLKIWLNAPISCRIKRIQFRDVVEDEETALCTTIEREKSEATRYRMYYDIDIADMNPYHIILNSERFGIDELGAIVDAAILFVKL